MIHAKNTNSLAKFKLEIQIQKLLDRKLLIFQTITEGWGYLPLQALVLFIDLCKIKIFCFQFHVNSQRTAVTQWKSCKRNRQPVKTKNLDYLGIISPCVHLPWTHARLPGKFINISRNAALLSILEKKYHNLLQISIFKD